MSQDFVQLFKAAKRVSTPLIAVRTADPASTIRTLTTEAIKPDVPVCYWNIMHGLAGVNSLGVKEATRLLDGKQAAMVTARPTDVLTKIETVKEDVVIFFANAQRFWGDVAVVQGIWNLRDRYKATGATLVLLTTAGSQLPAELTEDVLILDEPLPSESELKAIGEQTFKNANMDEPSKNVSAKIVDALIGLAAFPAEQSLAMSLTKSGLDIPGLWERKRQVVEQTPGMSIWRGTEKFAQIGGAENAKQFVTAMTSGKNSPRVIVFVDEIEKHFAGTGTDSSGVKTEMTGTMLTWMQDHKAKGIILIGPPGAAKSVFAKAAGNEAGIPTIAFDFSAMQDSLVGKSGERLRAALKVVEAISQGRSLFIATCNKLSVLPPELRRRFKRGTFFFDLPNERERDLIWKIYEKKFNRKDARPDDTNWTGAEIEQCCEIADDLGLTLSQASAYIVPVATSAAEEIKSLREQADGKFIDASNAGVYRYSGEVASAPSMIGKARRIRADEVGSA